jgi:diguanylate cyclase (GGDEF)-like protein
LSGLSNRSLFMDRLELALTGALKRGAKIAVLLANLNGFRSVNNSLGYEAGDRLLLAIAERFENTVGPLGTVAHFGGDQFAVLLEDVASMGDAVRVARRIEEGLRRPLDLGGLERVVTTSIGIGLSTPHWEPPGETVRRADAAMYHAKEAGKGHHAIFDPGADEGAST